MQRLTLLLLSIVVLGILNYGIYQKETIIANGEIVLLKLAPVDPRSLMQGDYMRLRYDISRIASATQLERHIKRGYIVVTLDENKVAQFTRFHHGETLNNNEKLLHFHYHYGLFTIVPNTFFFQEGHSHYYENAKYGAFKFDDNNQHILIGLADQNQTLITVK